MLGVITKLIEFSTKIILANFPVRLTVQEIHRLESRVRVCAIKFSVTNDT